MILYFFRVETIARFAAFGARDKRGRELDEHQLLAGAQGAHANTLTCWLVNMLHVARCMSRVASIRHGCW